MFAALAAAATLGACSSDGYTHAIQNLEEKLGNPNGEPSAGADYYKGASAAAIYLYVHPGEYGSVGKVSIHEYHHIVQQAMLQGMVTSLTPPADTLGNTRFQVKDYGNVGSTWPAHIKGIMDALPASLKLIQVPTYVLLIPEAQGGIGDSTVVANAIADLVPLLWPNDCAGVDFQTQWYQMENGALAEGEAEYYAANVYMAVGANTYNDDNLNWDGAADWTTRMMFARIFVWHLPPRQDAAPSPRTRSGRSTKALC